MGNGETAMITIIPLSEDIKGLIGKWKTNTKATEAQTREWPQDSTLHDYFCTNGTCSWPSDHDLVRFGLSVHCDVYRISALVLKGQFERHCCNQMGLKLHSDGDLIDTLRLSPKEAMDLSVSFKPGLNNTSDAKTIYAFVEQYKLASGAGYDEENFVTLMDQMIVSYCHLFGNESPELQDFIDRQRMEQKLLLKASKQEAEEFCLKKCEWIELVNDRGTRLLELENQRLKNANIDHKWMKTFGQTYLPLVEAEHNYHSLLRRIQLKQADPDLTLAEIEIREMKQREEELDRLEELRLTIASAMVFEIPERVHYMDGKQASEYETEARKILTEIYKYAHPDRTALHQFTDSQREKLRDSFEKAIRIRDEEKGGDFRSRAVLADILKMVKDLWATMGLDVREDAVIQGTTVQEHLQWVEGQLQKLEEQIREIRADLYALINDADVREKRASMASGGQIADTTRQMEERKNWFEGQAALLKRKLRFLFKTEEL